jgi:hypothetical protein
MAILLTPVLFQVLTLLIAITWWPHCRRMITAGNYNPTLGKGAKPAVWTQAGGWDRDQNGQGTMWSFTQCPCLTLPTQRTLVWLLSSLLEPQRHLVEMQLLLCHFPSTLPYTTTPGTGGVPLMWGSIQPSSPQAQPAGVHLRAVPTLNMLLGLHRKNTGRNSAQQGHSSMDTSAGKVE